MDHALWDHLPVLVRAKSKESVEHILQSLWRTRKTGLDAPEKAYIQDLLQLPAENDLDPLLVCLRILIRRCVYENFNKDEIQKLFPPEVPPELQRLLVLLLMKFQREWREDAVKDQVSLPRLKAMTWSMENQSTTPANRMAVINLRAAGEKDVSPIPDSVKSKWDLHWGVLLSVEGHFSCINTRLESLIMKSISKPVLQETTQSSSGETDVKFQITKDTLEAMLRSMYYIRDQLSNVGATSSGQALRKGQQ